MTSITDALAVRLAARPARTADAPATFAVRVMTVGVVLGAAGLLLAAGGLLLDPRTIAGDPAWLKPLKFGVAITTYFVVQRWIVGLIPGHARRLAIFSVLVVTAFTAETVLIDLQVVRGTTSHFNESTLFDSVVWYLMAGFVGLLTLSTLVFAALALRIRGLDRGVAAGLRWGVLVSVLGMFQAVTMLVNPADEAAGAHTVGAPDGGAGMWLTGWSLTDGDLRIGHFLGLHALQALPLLAFLLLRLTRLDERVRARLATIAGVALAAAVVLVTWQALRGQPLLQPDGVTLAAAGALAAAVGAAVLVVLLGARRRTAGGPASAPSRPAEQAAPPSRAVSAP